MSTGFRAFAIAAIVLFFAACLCAGGAAWMIWYDNGLPAEPADIIIPEGSSVNDIAAQLVAHDVIRNASVLALYVRLHGGGERIQAAEYEFPAHESIAQVTARLAAGGKPPTVWVTIPEGFTAAQVGRRLAAANLVSESAFVAVVRSTSLPFGSARSASLEGYLFPDTYQVPRKTTAAAVAAIFAGQFLRELPQDYGRAARRLRFSVPQIVTIASMIEREAKVDAERSTIASVIYNRLRRGMPLEVDATIEYALPRHKAALSFADLAIDSPYNTYRHAGLPPTPISNPGKASLYAAFHPATTPYLYYVYKGGGRHAFSTSLEQQQENVHRYLR